MQKLKRKGLPAAAGVGIVMAAALTALLCLLPAALIGRRLLPQEAGAYCACAAAGLAVFAAVLFIARLRGRQALPTGGCVAGGVLALAALLCALGGAEADFGPWLLRLGCAVIAGGVLGAVMSIRGKRRPR